MVSALILVLAGSAPHYRLPGDTGWGYDGEMNGMKMVAVFGKPVGLRNAPGGWSTLPSDASHSGLSHERVGVSLKPTVGVTDRGNVKSRAVMRRGDKPLSMCRKR